MSGRRPTIGKLVDRANEVGYEAALNEAQLNFSSMAKKQSFLRAFDMLIIGQDFIDQHREIKNPDRLGLALFENYFVSQFS